MNIVILDGYTSNPGDLSWEPFENLGSLTVYDSTLPHQVIDRCRDCEIVISNKTPLTKELLENMPWVTYIGLLSTGYNIVDLETATRLNIPVAYVPDYSTNAVAQHTFALLLELCNHVGAHATAVREGQWEQCSRFCFWNAPLTELSGKTFGIFGMGNIGKKVAAIADALGMKVIYHSRTPKKDLPYQSVDFETLLTESDVLSLHCPLTPQTRGMIHKETLAKMKPTAFLLNTSRGPVFNEEDVAQALKDHKLAGVGVDVLGQEPPIEGSPLISAPNCVITPHIAWAAKETRERLIAWAAENLQAFLEGHPQNLAK